MKSLSLPVDAFITDNLIYKRALTLANHGKSAPYERLEFLGDRVLGLILADMLYHHFPKESEGDWAMRFTLLAQEGTLAEVAKKIGLPKRIITTENTLRLNNSILSDVCEALIAAVYLDQGIEKAKNFVHMWWTPLLNRSHDTIKDAKSALQEWAQKRQEMPQYTVISRKGPDHAPQFTVEVNINGFGQAQAVGHSKKDAEQKAAKQLLDSLSGE